MRISQSLAYLGLCSPRTVRFVFAAPRDLCICSKCNDRCLPSIAAVKWPAAAPYLDASCQQRAGQRNELRIPSTAATAGVQCVSSVRAPLSINYHLLCASTATRWRHVPASTATRWRHLPASRTTVSAAVVPDASLGSHIFCSTTPSDDCGDDRREEGRLRQGLLHLRPMHGVVLCLLPGLRRLSSVDATIFPGTERAIETLECTWKSGHSSFPG